MLCHFAFKSRRMPSAEYRLAVAKIARPRQNPNPGGLGVVGSNPAAPTIIYQ
jgi:hypothetical protein